MNIIRPSSTRSNHDLDLNRGGQQQQQQQQQHDLIIPSMRRTQSVSECHDYQKIRITKPVVRNFDSNHHHHQQQQQQQSQQQQGAPQLQQRPSIDVFLKIARQREEIQALSTQLRQVQVESDTTRKAFLSHVHASKRKSNADDEMIERLERENELLRRQLLEVEVTAATTTTTATGTGTGTGTIGPTECAGQTPTRTLDEADEEDTPNETANSYASDDGVTAIQTSSFASDVFDMFNEATLDDSLNLTEDSIEILPTNDDRDQQRQYQLKSSAASQDSEASDSACRAYTGLTNAESMLSDFMVTSQQNKNSISKASMLSRCQSEGLIVGFGGSDMRKNGAANLLSKMRANNNNNNQATSVAHNNTTHDDGDDGGGGGKKLNSSWGLIRPKQTTSPPKQREHNKPVASNNNSSQNSLWGLMRSNQSSPAMNNSHNSATSNNNSSSQNALWSLLRPNQNSVADNNQGGGEEVPGSSSSQNSSRGVMKTNQPSVVPTNSTSQNSLLGLIKSRSHQNNAAPKHTQVAPSSDGAATTSSQRNSSWGLKRSKSRANNQHSYKSSITEDQIPEDVPYKPPQNLTWSLIRRQQTATQKSMDDLRKKKEMEEEEAKRNSSWGGLVRSNHQSSPEFGNAIVNLPGLSLYANLAQNSTWGTVQVVTDFAHPTPIGTTTTQKIKFGSSGDEWATPDDEDAEERIQRLVRERAARRKGRARSNSADLLLDPRENATPPLEQQQQQQPTMTGMRKCSSSTLLERHTLERRTTTQSNELFVTNNCPMPIVSREGETPRNSLCPIPESRG